MPQVALADIDVYYASQGTGPPLLLVPGMAQPVAELQPLIAALAEERTVIAPDNRGAGRTSAPRGPYSIAQMAGDLRRLMDQLGIDRAPVLGISMGGRIALSIALTHPERVERLVLVSTSARVAGRRALSRLLMEIGLLPGLRGANPMPPHAMRAQFTANTRFNCVARLGDIAQPALVVHGSTDPIVPLALAGEMQRGIRGSRMVLLEGGHRIALEAGTIQQICNEVRPFLAGDR